MAQSPDGDKTPVASGGGAFVHSRMLGILPLECPVRHYDWGSRSALGRLLSRPASGRPEAELWMGAHPTAPSVARVGARRVALDRLIAEHPTETLGRLGRAALGGHDATLPFLFKVLALGKPVSVQAHPTRARVVRGFEAEQRAGIPLDAPRRSYRDSGHKPEVMVALEPMVVLSGIRPLQEIEAALTAAGAGELAALAATAAGQDAAGAIRRLLRATLTLDGAAGARLHRHLVDGAARDTAEGALLAELAEHYPGDPTVIAALLLNRVELEPGEALYTPPGRLHALVSGAGIELMANSDNVLRAGLTSKHVDADELLAASELRPVAPARIVPRTAGWAERVYPTPAEEFQLSVVDLAVGGRFTPHGPEILLLLGDRARLCWPGGTLTLRRGDAVFVAASVAAYEARGTGRLYRARAGSGI